MLPDFITDKDLRQMGPEGPLQPSADAQSWQPEIQYSL